MRFSSPWLRQSAGSVTNLADFNALAQNLGLSASLGKPASAGANSNYSIRHLFQELT